MNFMLEGQNSAELTNLIGSGNPNTGRGQVHQARAPEESGDLPGQGGPGEARAAAGPDGRATPAAQQAVDRDQGRPLIEPSARSGRTLAMTARSGSTRSRLRARRVPGFFDHERGPAFADNPEWAKCYCHFYQVPKAVAGRASIGDANRDGDGGAHRGRAKWTAFSRMRADEVVGWLNAQPRHKAAALLCPHGRRRAAA